MADEFNPPRARQSRKFIIVTALCSAVVLAAAIAFIFSGIKPISQPRELTLPDGTTVRIEALTFGKEHSYSTDPVREKLARWAPALCRRFLGKGILSAKMLTDADSLVIWITRQDPTSGYVFAQDEWHYTKDRHGCEFQSIYRTSRSLGGRIVLGLAFDNFPRGEETFDYVITDRDGKRLGRCTLTNPFKAAPARWVAEKLPITKTNGELVVELRRLAPVYSVTPQMPFDPEIEIIQSMQRGSWEKPLIQISDPLGNRCPGLFCTNEHLWKIETDFFRTGDSQFRPEETWLITNVAIPRIDGVNLLHTTNTLQGARVAVVDLRGFLYADPLHPNTPQTAAEGFVLSVESSQHVPAKVLIRARDHVGRDLITRARDLFPTTLRQIFSEVQQQFEIQPLPDSQSLTLEVIVQKPVRFEFFVGSNSYGRNP